MVHCDLYIRCRVLSPAPSLVQSKDLDLLRHLDSCHSVHAPRYQSSGFPGGLGVPSSPRCSSRVIKKLWKGAVNTAATSLASSRGIRDTSGSAFCPVFSSYECRSATQGRTTSSVFARLAGSSQRCSTRKGGGSGCPIFGSPISSCASRRAVSKGVSDNESALPVYLPVNIIRLYTHTCPLSFPESDLSINRLTSW